MVDLELTAGILISSGRMSFDLTNRTANKKREMQTSEYYLLVSMFVCGPISAQFYFYCFFMF